MDATQNLGMKSYLVIWTGLLLIAGAEVVLTYRGFSAAGIAAGSCICRSRNRPPVFHAPEVRTAKSTLGSDRCRYICALDDERNLARRLSHGEPRASLVERGACRAIERGANCVQDIYQRRE